MGDETLFVNLLSPTHVRWVFGAFNANTSEFIPNSNEIFEAMDEEMAQSLAVNWATTDKQKRKESN